MKNRITDKDIDFRYRMETCVFAVAEFNHRAHLRLAYIYLCENSVEKSVDLMGGTLNRFLRHNGVDPSKFHATLTKAWILAVHHFMNKTPYSVSADDFVDRNPEMLDTKIMMTHYSAKILFSDEARAGFVQPDLDPIPRYGP